MPWDTRPDGNGYVRCDSPGCAAEVVEGSLSGACWRAEIEEGWLLVGGRTTGRAYCPSHTVVTLTGAPTCTPWLTGSEQGRGETGPLTLSGADEADTE